MCIETHSIFPGRRPFCVCQTDTDFSEGLKFFFLYNCLISNTFDFQEGPLLYAHYTDRHFSLTVRHTGGPLWQISVISLMAAFVCMFKVSREIQQHQRNIRHNTKREFPRTSLYCIIPYLNICLKC